MKRGTVSKGMVLFVFQCFRYLKVKFVFNRLYYNKP
jgi:hypothetical protein